MVKLTKESMGQMRTLSSWQRRLAEVSGAALALMIINILGRGVTVLTQMVIAREFGATIYAEAFFATEVIPELFTSLVAGGFGMVFIPLFAQYRLEQGEAGAWRFASAFLVISTLFSIVFAILVAIGAPFLVRVIAPGFEGEARDITITLIRIMAVSLLLLGLNAGLRGLLQSHREFVVPDSARLLYTIVLCVAAWGFSQQYGVVVLAWGIVFGTGAQLLIQLWRAIQGGLFQSEWAFSHPGIKEATKRIFPLLIATAGLQVFLVLDRMAASELVTGSIAWLNYANRMILLPVGIFAIPLQTTLYPTLSQLAVEGQFEELAEKTLSGLRILLFIVIPACVGLTVLRIPLTQLLFQRGAFDSVATYATGDALLYYAIGAPSMALILLVNSIYFAMNDLSTLVKINLASWVINFGLNLLLRPYLGFQGIALATSLTVILTTGMILVFLKRNSLDALDIGALLTSIAKIGGATAVMGGVLFAVQPYLSGQLLPPSPLQLIVQILVTSGIGGIVYLAVAYFWKLGELNMLATSIRGLLK